MAMSENQWAAFQSLEHHTDDFRKIKGQGGAESWENIQLMAKAAKEYSQSTEALSYVETLICRVSGSCKPSSLWQSRHCHSKLPSLAA